jgi:hypothetical protein
MREDMKQEKETGYLERPGTIRKLWVILFIICGLTVVSDIFLRGEPHEPHFGIDHYFGFYAFLGFVACAVLILFAKAVGFILKRKENYYD